MGKKPPYPMQGLPGDKNGKGRKGRWKKMGKRSDYWTPGRKGGILDYWTEVPKMRVANADGTGVMKSIEKGRPYEHVKVSERVALYGSPYEVEGLPTVKVSSVEVEGFFKDNKTPIKRKERFNELIHHLVKSAFAEIHAVNLSLPPEDRYIFYNVGPYNPRYMTTDAILQNYGELWTAMGFKKPLKKETKNYKLKAGEAWEGGKAPTKGKKQIVDAKGEVVRRTAWGGIRGWRDFALAADIWRKVPKKVSKYTIAPSDVDWDGTDAYPPSKGDGWRTNSRVSNHTFGMAMDINDLYNKNGRRPKGVKEFDIPPWVSAIFLNHGFYWGGLYNNSGDHMHFEYEQKHVLEELPPPLPKPKAPGARTWVYPVPNKTADELYSLNEKGGWGYFPIGGTNAWHGGIHLPIASDVRCVADGRVIAARLPESDSAQTSNSFILVRHELPIKAGKKEKIQVAWSLYAHLKPFKHASDSADAPDWIKPLLAESENTVDGIDPTKKYAEVLVEEDPDMGGGRDDPKVGLNMRASASKGDVVAVLRPGTLVEVIKGGKWSKVKVREGAAAGTEGYLLTKRSRRLGDRVRWVDPGAIERAKKIKEGAIVALDVKVKAGDKLAEVGRHASQAAFHMEVFTEQPLHDSMPELKGFMVFANDDDSDALLDDDQLKAFANAAGGSWFPDKVVTLDEARKAASDLRNSAVRFTSEWGAGGWKRLEGKPWNVKLVKRHLDYIASQQWWKQAKAAHKAAKTEDYLPAKPLLWHYHPVTLISRLQKAYGEKGSQAPVATTA